MRVGDEQFGACDGRWTGDWGAMGEITVHRKEYGERNERYAGIFTRNRTDALTNGMRDGYVKEDLEWGRKGPERGGGGVGWGVKGDSNQGLGCEADRHQASGTTESTECISSPFYQVEWEDELLRH